MCGGVKLMLSTINSSEEVITGTVAHLDGVVELLRQIAPGSKSFEQRRIAALQLVETCKSKVTATYYSDSWKEAHVDMLHSELLNFFMNCRVKVNRAILPPVAQSDGMKTSNSLIFKCS